MVFVDSALWMSPPLTIGASMGALIVGVVALMFLLIESGFFELDYLRQKITYGSLIVASLVLLGAGVIGLVMADQDRRQAQQALTAQAEQVYGLELQDAVTSHLLEDHTNESPLGLYDLQAGGEAQIRKVIGEISFVSGGRDRFIRLSWDGEVWALQERKNDRWTDIRPLPVETAQEVRQP